MSQDQLKIITVIAVTLEMSVLALTWIIICGIIVPAYFCRRHKIGHWFEIVIVAECWGLMLLLTIVTGGGLIAYHHFFV